MKLLTGVVPLLAVLLASCASAPKPLSPSTQAARAASPASLNCVQNQGRLEIIRTPEGEQGICVLPSGKRCDEWEMFRGNCPVRTVNVNMGRFGL